MVYEKPTPSDLKKTRKKKDRKQPNSWFET